MNENNEVVTATLSLTKDQWRDIIQHIMNDASILEMGLCAQAGRDAVIKMLLVLTSTCQNGNLYMGIRNDFNSTILFEFE